MKLATWNVNSIRARQDLVIEWLKEAEPDVLCMQETKVEDDDFPTEQFLRLGYTVVMAGQRSYNGVAIASRLPPSDVLVGLHDQGDLDQQRIISATVDDVRVVCVYVPNGQSVDSPEFPRKLEWLRRLKGTLEATTSPKARLVVCGDFNIAPEPRDVYDPEKFAGRVHFHPEEHQALAQLKRFGLIDAFRLHHEQEGLYSWWDYRAGAFRRNLGLRIDLILVTENLAKCCVSAEIDKAPRTRPKPSDHTPVLAVFETPSRERQP